MVQGFTRTHAHTHTHSGFVLLLSLQLSPLQPYTPSDTCYLALTLCLKLTNANTRSRTESFKHTHLSFTFSPSHAAHIRQSFSNSKIFADQTATFSWSYPNFLHENDERDLFRWRLSVLGTARENQRKPKDPRVIPLASAIFFRVIFSHLQHSLKNV